MRLALDLAGAGCFLLTEGCVMACCSSWLVRKIGGG